MFSFYLGDLKIHGNDVSNFWLQTPLEGLDSPEYRINSYNKPGEDGGIVSNAFYGQRMVTLVGIIKGTGAADFEQNRRLFSQACAIQRDGNGYPVLTRCTLTTVGGSTYYFDAQLDKPQFNYEDVNWCKFMLKLIIPDPQIYLQTPIDSGLIPLAQATGVTFPVTWPIVFGGSIGGSISLVNSGTMFTWPILTLYGQLTSPVIYNSTVGKFIQLNYVLASGDFITIDMAQKTIMLNGESSLIGDKTTDSDWWAIEPDLNVITLGSAVNGENGKMQITYNPAMVGI